jgi:hypothetical protein
MPRGHCLATKGHLFVPGVNVLTSSSATLKLNLHLIILTFWFFKKMLKDYEFDDVNKSDELQKNNGVVMLKGI